MYNLRTIPEIHPYEKIIRTLRISGLDDKFVGFVDANLKNTFEKNPKRLKDNIFWCELEGQVTDEFNRRMSVAEENPILREVYIRIIFREAFESSKHVWSSEFDEIESGRYKVLYHEGRTGKPICPYAETHGLKVVYLGRDNPYHLAIVNGDVHEEDEENQRKREGVWLERIQPSYEIEESLLIVGAHHAKDRYGLTTNLLAQRIRLIELFDFFKFSDKLVDRLLEENMNEMTALFRVNKGDLVQIVNRHSLTG